MLVVSASEWRYGGDQLSSLCVFIHFSRHNPRTDLSSLQFKIPKATSSTAVNVMCCLGRTVIGGTVAINCHGLAICHRLRHSSFYDTRGKYYLNELWLYQISKIHSEMIFLTLFIGSSVFLILVYHIFFNFVVLLNLLFTLLLSSICISK